MPPLIYPRDAARLKVEEGSLLLIGGAETFFVDEILRDLKLRLAPRGFRPRLLFAETMGDADVAELPGGGDLFAERHLVVVKGCRTAAKGVGMRAATATAIANSLAAADRVENVVVFVEPPDGKAPARIANLKGLVHVVCYPLFPAKLKAWIAERAEKAGYGITRRAVDALAKRLDGNMGRIAAELEKLFLYMDRETEIDLAHVEKTLYPYPESALDAARDVARLARSRRRAEALALLRRAIEHGVTGIEIAAHLRGQFRELLEARAALDARPDERFEARLRRYLKLLPLDDYQANQERKAIQEECRAWLEGHPGAGFAEAAGFAIMKRRDRALAESLAHALAWTERDLLALNADLFALEARLKSGAVDGAAGVELFVALFPEPSPAT